MVATGHMWLLSTWNGASTLKNWTFYFNLDQIYIAIMAGGWIAQF